MIKKPHIINDVEYLQFRRRHCIDEMLKSLDLFEQSEMLFNQRTAVTRAKYKIPTGEPLSVEAIIDRKNDEQWQVAVADCRYYNNRSQMYSGAYDTITQRLEDLQR